MVLINERKDLDHDPRICVLGAGHGGMAMAGHLAMAGYKVNLYNRSEERLEPVRLMGGIELSGEIEGFGPINLATSNIAEAIQDAEILMVVVPANGHAFIAEQAAPTCATGSIFS